MQYREVNKNHVLEDFANKIKNVKLFSASIKKRHALMKDAKQQVLLEDPSISYNKGLRTSLLPTEQANIYTSTSAIPMINKNSNVNLNNPTQNLISNTDQFKSNIKGKNSFENFYYKIKNFILI